MSKFNAPQKLEKKMKCAQNAGCTSSMYEQSYVKYEYIGMNTVGVTDYTN